MDRQGHRPPRSARPSSQQPSPSRHDPRPPVDQNRNVSFQKTERSDRQAILDQARGRTYSAYQNNTTPTDSDPALAESGGYAGANKKKTLVKPEREKIEPGHRQWHYRTHAGAETDGVDVMPSRKW